MDNKLTPKQSAFADYYIETGNATEAARRAGYKKPNTISIEIKEDFVLPLPPLNQ